MRSKGQILIGCWCDEALVEKIDNARRAKTRSQFFRDAVAEKLRGLGIEVADAEVASPSRAGKGGPRVTYRLRQYQAALNEGSGTAPSPAPPRSSKKSSQSSDR